MKTKMRVRDRAGRVIDVDEDEWEAFCRHKGIVRDGQRMRVPVTVADAAGRELPNWMIDDEDDGDELTHSEVRAAAALACRPEPVSRALMRLRDERPDFVADAEQELLDARAEYNERLTNSWRRPPPVRDASAVFLPNASAGVDPEAALRRAYSSEPLAPVVTPAVALPGFGLGGVKSLDDLVAQLEEVRRAADAQYRALLENAWRR